MKKADAEALLGKEDLGPIDAYLEALAVPGHYSALALGICTLRIEESAPTLRAALIRAANDPKLTDAEWSLFFQGIHVLGGARDQPSFQPLLQLLHLPGDDLEDLLGDSITGSLSRIVAGVFDGDTEALFAAIADKQIDAFVRDALLGAATFLTWDGRIGRQRMRDFLHRFGEERLADDEDFVWMGWQAAIALLSFRDLAPMVSAAFAEERFPAGLIAEKEFEDDLVAAERAPDDKDRFDHADLGYIEDVADALSWMHRIEGLENAPDFAPAQQPIANPFRYVGRNDPCPCGSGKKAKKCCLKSG